MRILVCEDSKTAALVTEDLLVRAGHEVVVVDTIQKAGEELREDKYDLAVVDFLLPDGMMLTTIQQWTKTIPIVILSGMLSPTTVAVCMRYGAAGAVAKHDLSILSNEILLAVDYWKGRYG